MKNSIIINDTEIFISNNGTEKIVAIKPICKALGIDYPTQFSKLKEDSSLASRVGRSPITGADGKEYRMTCLPLKYISGLVVYNQPRKCKTRSKTTNN